MSKSCGEIPDSVIWEDKMEKRWLTKEEEKTVRKEIKSSIPGFMIPGIMILGILGVGIYTDPKVCGYAAIVFLPVAGILFWLAFREFCDLRKITEKRYVIKEFEVLETREVLTSGTPNRYATLREVGTEKVVEVRVTGTFYVLENNKFAYGIDIEGRKKRIYFGGRKG